MGCVTTDAILWDERAIAAAVAELRGRPLDLPPVLWDLPAHANTPPSAPQLEAEQPGVIGAERSALDTPMPVVEHSPAMPLHALDSIAAEETAHDTPSSRRAALLRATRDLGSTAAIPLQRVRLLPGDAAVGASPLEASAVATVAAPPPMVEPDNGWPVGPAPLGRVAMADLLARMVASPAIVAGQPNELGVTKNRVVELLRSAHKAQAKELAEILIAWLDLAHLLVEPTRPARLRHPRALVTTNLAEIAARLNASPCPDKATAATMWAESHEGRG
jgi:hypothetical protein